MAGLLRCGTAWVVGGTWLLRLLLVPARGPAVGLVGRPGAALVGGALAAAAIGVAAPRRLRPRRAGGEPVGNLLRLHETQKRGGKRRRLQL
jgi:hypothetical protein